MRHLLETVCIVSLCAFVLLAVQGFVFYAVCENETAGDTCSLLSLVAFACGEMTRRLRNAARRREISRLSR